LWIDWKKIIADTLYGACHSFWLETDKKSPADKANFVYSKPHRYFMIKIGILEQITMGY